MGFALLKRRGWDRFATGVLSLKGFGNELAKEWASFPVLVDMQGASRRVERGQSYYAGDGLNKSLVKPGDVEAVLSDVLNRLSVSNPPAKPGSPSPKPSDTQEATKPVSAPRRGGWIVLAVLAVGGLLTAGWEWIVSLFGG